MEWMPAINSAKKALSTSKLKSELSHLRDLIDTHLKNLILGPKPITGSGIDDYLDLDTTRSSTNIFQKYKRIPIDEVNRRHLVRAVQFVNVNNLDMVRETHFSPEFRESIFSMFKAAAILEVGSYLGKMVRRRNIFANIPRDSQLKQDAIDRFAFRYLNVIASEEYGLLTDKDKALISSQYNLVNKISRSKLDKNVSANLAFDPLIQAIFPKLKTSDISRA